MGALLIVTFLTRLIRNFWCIAVIPCVVLVFRLNKTVG